METLYRDLNSLVIFRHILQAAPMHNLLKLLSCPQDNPDALCGAYADFAAELLAENCNFSQYLLRLVLEDENIYTRYKTTGEGDSAVLDPLLTRELNLLSRAAVFDGSEQRAVLGDPTLAAWQTETLDFNAIYHERLGEMSTKGFGIFAKYHMFMLDDNGALVPIKNPDPQKLSDLFGYERERGKIIANTKALLEGKPANNVLLYGDAGTGKSSTVKAIGNEFAKDGLRLVELKKNQLYLIPGLLDTLAVNPLKFILFIDDLTFASDDRDFCALKAILEGGVSSRSNNVLIYATSNHRHMIKETNADRQGDEISITDKLQEIVSLSARFGLTVTFTRPDKMLYSDIVVHLAREAGIDMDEDTLIMRAEAHAIRSGGRNPRTAKQFVDLLAAGVL